MAWIPSVLDGILGIERKLAQKANCEQCLYRKPDWRDGGHCYMFRERPGERCGQFRKVESRRLETEINKEGRV